MPNKKKQHIKLNNQLAGLTKKTNLSDMQVIKNDIARLVKNIPVAARRMRNFLASLPSSMKKTINSLILKIKLLPESYKKWRTKDRKKKKYRSFRLQKKISTDLSVLPSAKLLLWNSVKFMGRHFWLILKILIIHLVLYLVFVKTPATTLSVDEIKETVNLALGEGGDRTVNGTLATLSTVIGLNAVTGANSAKSSVLILLMSLVYIWAIRQTINGHTIKARDAYYQGFAPLISSLLILVVMTLQLTPFALVSFLYSVARTGGVFVSGLEDMSFFIVTALVGIISFYFITSTIIAFYVATLPGMYPMQAFVSAKRLVSFQRLTVFKRVILLPIILGATYVLLLLFFIRFIPDATMFFNEAFPFAVLPLIHTYYYKLYRSLI